MALNRSKLEIVGIRRRRVAALVLRGLTQREIVQALANPRHPTDRIVNPRTGEPYSLGTIHSDIVALRKLWLEESLEDIQSHKSVVLAELAEVKRFAWTKGELVHVLRALSQQAKLLGLNEPEGVDLKSGGEPIRFQCIEIVKDYGPPGTEDSG